MKTQTHEKSKARLEETCKRLNNAIEELHSDNPNPEFIYYQLDSVFHYVSAVKYQMKKASDIL